MAFFRLRSRQAHLQTHGPQPPSPWRIGKPMSISTLLLLLVIAALLASGFVSGCHLPPPYRTRPCQGRAWRRAFPGASRHEIRAFLSLFVSAFAYNERDKLKFAPSDALLDIYRAQYPSRWTADAMELETLALELARSHHLDLAALWQDKLTLGDLFAQAHPNATKPPPASGRLLPPLEPCHGTSSSRI
jgi:hypothetical protein